MTKVSTITPCYNMGRYIKGFLENVATQTHKDLQIVLDHNHKTGEVRGYLCESCNTGIGRFDDDVTILKRAITYLE